MRCALVDDVQLFNEEVIKQLGDRFPDLKGAIEVIPTEKAFRERLASLATFDFVILDVMVHWTDPSDETSRDAMTVQGGYFRAGIRCLAEMRKIPELAAMPVIIHSALDEDQIRASLPEWGITPDHLAIVSKQGDLSKLFEAVGRQLSSSTPHNLSR